MYRMTFTAAAAAASVLAGATPALAHIALTAPRARTDSLKSGPCGDPGSTRGANVCALRPGATITVTWDETVEHPGHFRIAFDEDGNDFTDPTGFDDTSGGPGVLIDGIADRVVSSDDRGYSQDVTLPNVECDNCTLQVIQVMSDKAPYGDGNDIYYQCADLTLSASAPAEPDQGCDGEAGGGGGGGGDAGPGGDGSSDEDGGGCDASGAGGGWMAGLLAAAAAAGARRRRRRPVRGQATR